MTQRVKVFSINDEDPIASGDSVMEVPRRLMASFKIQRVETQEKTRVNQVTYRAEVKFEKRDG